jgi:hypothetical protein
MSSWHVLKARRLDTQCCEEDNSVKTICVCQRFESFVRSKCRVLYMLRCACASILIHLCGIPVGFFVCLGMCAAVSRPSLLRRVLMSLRGRTLPPLTHEMVKCQHT